MKHALHEMYTCYQQVYFEFYKLKRVIWIIMAFCAIIQVIQDGKYITNPFGNKIKLNKKETNEM